MITIFLYFVLRAKRTFKVNILIGLLLGIITMIRVTNFIIVIFYLFYDVKSLPDLKNKLLAKKYYQNCAVVFVFFIIGFLPQLLYWNYATGHFLVNSYTGEGFNWFNPHIISFLFSIKKGLFFWTPLWIFAFTGIFIARIKYKEIFRALIIYHILQLYITSSWYCWDYGGSFGQRPYTDIASVLAISLAFFLDYVREINFDGKLVPAGRKIAIKPLINFLIIVFIVLNLLLMVGYWHQKIPYNNTEAGHIQDTFLWYFNMIFGR